MTYEMIKKNYDEKLWNARQVLACVNKGLITREEANRILNNLEETKAAAVDVEALDCAQSSYTSLD